ncbi:TolC family protein [Parafilimonas sp.]|uniref:TolC family protein n=1 Tax=Parafilimonas sp. TaxID=1969739 RepID=UPI0039E4CE93
MMKYIAIFLLLFLSGKMRAQDTATWDLRKCVDYAMANNVSVQQSDVQARLATLDKKAANWQAIPTLGFNTQAGWQFGRSIDPTTNQFTNNEVFFQSYTLQSGITLFNFFSIKNNKLAAAKNEEAAKIGIDKAKNDVALNVAASYLQTLLAVEQANIAKVQIDQTRAQLDNTRKLVDAGSMPELNAAQLESQLATDSSSYISALGTADQNRIQLVAMLNLNESTPFRVATPDVDKIPIPPLSELDPAYIYQLALGSQPLQQSDSVLILSGEYAVKSARGAMYPTLSAFGQVSTNYASTYSQPVGNKPYSDTVFTHAGDYIVSSGLVPVYGKAPYFKQMGNINFAQSFGVSLNIPILNGRQLRTSYDRAKLNLENYRLQKRADDLTLQQNVYTAYSNAAAALAKYNSSTKAVQTQQYAYDLATKRYEIGILSTIDYITIQTNLFTAKINQASAKYDYIFKMKVLEFYKGQGVQF